MDRDTAKLFISIRDDHLFQLVKENWEHLVDLSITPKTKGKKNKGIKTQTKKKSRVNAQFMIVEQKQYACVQSDDPMHHTVLRQFSRALRIFADQHEVRCSWKFVAHK